MDMPIAVQVVGLDGRRIVIMIKRIILIEDMGDNMSVIYVDDQKWMKVKEPYNSLFERVFGEKPHEIDSGDSGRDNAEDSGG